jgi:hypothetical protein
MEENTGPGIPEEPKTDPLTNSTNEVISRNDPESDNPNREKDNMEVHHHAHHQGKKNWKSYFYEFLMLFLAVTLGFFVENQREHHIENVRAEEFSKALIQDLQNDIAAIQTHKKTTSFYLALSDSLINLSQSPLEGRTSAQFGFYTRFMYWTAAIVWNRATFDQIKNSGSLRYFKNQKLLEKLMKYEGAINNIEMEAYNNQVRGNLLVNHINKIIEPVYHQRLSRHYLYSYDTITPEIMENLFPTHPESLENRRNEIRELLNMVVVQQRNMRSSLESDYPEAEQMARNLINDLKNEYPS